jgi:hypothetical protein
MLTANLRHVTGNRITPAKAEGNPPIQIGAKAKAVLFPHGRAFQRVGRG